MSKSEEKASERELGELENDSVYDFLYHDSRRIASFLSQFDDNGLLTGLSQGDSVTKGTKRSKKFGLGGNSPLGGGNLEFELGPRESGSHNLERVYDPYWANALTFLDYLGESDMIQRDISRATFGQFVLSSGSLGILDLVMFKEAWKLDTFRKSVMQGALKNQDDGQGNRAERRANKSKNSDQKKDDTNLMIEMVGIMPHSVHASIAPDDGGEGVWCALTDEYMVSKASELVLSHGSIVPGTWHVLGILNGRPDTAAIDGLNAVNSGDVGGGDGTMDSMIGRVSGQLAPIVRLLLGRPAQSYAVTPLLIFREVMPS